MLGTATVSGQVRRQSDLEAGHHVNPLGAGAWTKGTGGVHVGVIPGLQPRGEAEDGGYGPEPQRPGAARPVPIAR